MEPFSGVREARLEDNQSLLELERSSPQGTRLVMHSERNDYFYRGRLFGNHRTTVAVHRDRLFGVLAATLKEVLVADEPVRAAMFYDLRFHPDYRNNVAGRHMLRNWRDTERWAERSGARLIYGMVKADNTPMLVMEGEKSGYRTCGDVLVIGRAVCGRQRTWSVPEEVDLERENAAMGCAVRVAYADRALYPTDLTGAYLSQAMRETGLFSCFRLRRDGSEASIGLYRVSREIWTRVLALPWYYHAARPITDALRPLVALPKIPRPGGSIAHYHTFNHLTSGPEGAALWRELLRHLNNVAFEEGATLLTSMFDPSDPLCAVFRRGAINVMPYRLGYRSFDGREYRLTPFFPDARDMD